MSKPKHDVANALPEVELDSAGFAHGLHLLLLAIARTNPAVGALLDEFTSMHAEYLAELATLDWQYRGTLWRRNSYAIYEFRHPPTDAEEMEHGARDR